MENNDARPPDPLGSPRPGSPEPGSYDAHTALADVGSARESVAARLVTPWWYHPALGLIIGAIVVTAALDLHNAIRLPVALGGAVGIGLLVGAYQRLTGLWVDMRNLGRGSRAWWLAYAVLVVVLVGTSLIPTFSGTALPPWLAALMGAAAVIGTIVLGRRVDATMREEIRTGAAPIPTPRR